jgi:hypothetical protein
MFTFPFVFLSYNRDLASASWNKKNKSSLSRSSDQMSRKLLQTKRILMMRFVSLSLLFLSFDQLLLVSQKSWDCLACTFRNSPSAQQCELCDNKRPNLYDFVPFNFFFRSPLILLLSLSRASSSSSSSSSSSTDSQVSLLIDFLIARSANRNTDSSAALKWAKEHGLDQFVSALLQDQAKQSNSNPVMFLLDWTVNKNCVPLLKLLLADHVS